LEEVFQAQVTHALHRLGVPPWERTQQLFQQIDRLSQTIQELAHATVVDAKARKAHIIKAPTPVATGIADPVV
jgi:hypothetical protein